MIKAYQPQQPVHRTPINETARKVFDEASGVSLVPEVEDRFEDMAADFLEQWLVSSEDPFIDTAKATPAAAEPEQEEKKPEPATPPAFEPEMSTFAIGLDWQLSDGRQIG